MKREIDKSIGERIRLRRKELKITGKQIYEATGISTGNLSELEAGNTLPSSIALIGLSGILNCSTDWILTGKTLNVEQLTSGSKDYRLWDSFSSLSDDDQEEILEFIDFKLKRAQRKK